MGANSKAFVRIRMEEEHYKQLSNQVRSNMELMYVEFPNFDYKINPKYKPLNSDYVKLSKKRREMQYDTRKNKDKYLKDLEEE
jgi:hypothetical protein